MKRLSKTQLKQCSKLSAEISEQHGILCEAIQKFNDTLEAAKVDVETAATAYNEILAAARDFCSEVVSEMDSYEGERSDKWHETDAASAFQDWKSEWESIDLEDFEPEVPNAMDEPNDAQETFDLLPEEVS